MRRRRGFMQLAILHLLEEAPMHGYQIMKELEQRSDGHYKASAGTVYPALQELLEKEFVELDPTSDKKTYQLQQAGIDRLIEFRQKRKGDFWLEWVARWTWRSSDEAIQLKESLTSWEIELKGAMKRARKNPEEAVHLVQFLAEMTKRLKKEGE